MFCLCICAVHALTSQTFAPPSAALQYEHGDLLNALADDQGRKILMTRMGLATARKMLVEAAKKQLLPLDSLLELEDALADEYDEDDDEYEESEEQGLSIVEEESGEEIEIDPEAKGGRGGGGAERAEAAGQEEEHEWEEDSEEWETDTDAEWEEDSEEWETDSEEEEEEKKEKREEREPQRRIGEGDIENMVDLMDRVADMHDDALAEDMNRPSPASAGDLGSLQEESLQSVREEDDDDDDLGGLRSMSARTSFKSAREGGAAVVSQRSAHSSGLAGRMIDAEAEAGGLVAEGSTGSVASVMRRMRGTVAPAVGPVDRRLSELDSRANRSARESTAGPSRLRPASEIQPAPEPEPARLSAKPRERKPKDAGKKRVVDPETGKRKVLRKKEIPREQPVGQALQQTEDKTVYGKGKKRIVTNIKQDLNYLQMPTAYGGPAPAEKSKKGKKAPAKKGGKKPGHRCVRPAIPATAPAPVKPPSLQEHRCANRRSPASGALAARICALHQSAPSMRQPYAHLPRSVANILFGAGRPHIPQRPAAPSPQPRQAGHHRGVWQVPGQEAPDHDRRGGGLDRRGIVRLGPLAPRPPPRPPRHA